MCDVVNFCYLRGQNDQPTKGKTFFVQNQSWACYTVLDTTTLWLIRLKWGMGFVWRYCLSIIIQKLEFKYILFALYFEMDSVRQVVFQNKSFNPNTRPWKEKMEAQILVLVEEGS